MIQDIGDHRFDNTYRPAEPTPDAFALAFDGHRILLSDAPDDAPEDSVAEKNAAPGSQPAASTGLATGAGPAATPPRVRDWGVPAEKLQLRYLFSIDDQEFFLVQAPVFDPYVVADQTSRLARADAGLPVGDDPADVPIPAGHAFLDLNVLRFLEPRWLGFGCVVAHHLSDWYEQTRFCGRCGSPMEHVAASREMACPTCANVVYPRISPAVIVAVCDGDRILLTKYAGREYVHFALVAGFVEVGETPEDAACREVAEEVGLSVRNIRYYKSQPWPFTGSLLMGFFADLDGAATVSLDATELRLGEWHTRDNIPVNQRDTSSLTNEMMRVFAAGTEPR